MGHAVADRDPGTPSRASSSLAIFFEPAVLEHHREFEILDQSPTANRISASVRLLARGMVASAR